MRKVSRWIAALTLIAGAAPLFLASAASAEFRDFSGKVAEISNDKMVIDNRRGDRVSFRRSEATTVTGAKTSWQAIEVGDRVSVSWKMIDQPRVAHEVVVRAKLDEGNAHFGGVRGLWRFRGVSRGIHPDRRPCVESRRRSPCGPSSPSGRLG